MREVVTADEFLTSPIMERQKKDVPVPELGPGKVIPVWGMTPRERTEFDDKKSRLKPAQREVLAAQIRERIVIECCRNDDGTQLFSEAQVEQLGQKRGDVFERLVNVCLDLSGFTGEDIDALAKNSETVPEG